MSELTDFHVFWGTAMTVAEKKSASMEDESAEDFARKLYEEYVAQGAPKNKKKWLTERLDNEFLCMKDKPVWVGEPAWLYHQGHPMVFLHQFLVPPTAQHIKEKISLGETVYVFGAKHLVKRPTGDIWTDIYRMAVQTYEGETTWEIFK